jgi:hypothetical protein
MRIWQVSTHVDATTYVTEPVPDEMSREAILQGLLASQPDLEASDLDKIWIVQCEWFALCTNDAVANREHPAFPGGVPVCESHQAE